MKHFNEEHVEAMIKLRYGGLVDSYEAPSYVPFWKLGKLFKCSGTLVRKLVQAKFARDARSKLPLIEQMKQTREANRRERYGYRFLKAHEVQWLTEKKTLDRQVGMSLYDRVIDGKKTFPTIHLNPTLLREVYRKAGIKKKKYAWFKQPPVIDELQRARQLRTMKRLLTMARRDGYRIIFIDETHFTRNTLPEVEWTLPGQNVSLDLVLR